MKNGIGDYSKEFKQDKEQPSLKELEQSGVRLHHMMAGSIDEMIKQKDQKDPRVKISSK